MKVARSQDFMWWLLRAGEQPWDKVAASHCETYWWLSPGEKCWVCGEKPNVTIRP